MADLLAEQRERLALLQERAVDSAIKAGEYGPYQESDELGSDDAA